MTLDTGDAGLSSRETEDRADVSADRPARDDRPGASRPGAAEALRAALAEAPWRFDFFQALRRIQCAYPGKPLLGESVRPADDPLRLGQEATLKFPPATIAKFEPGREGRPDRLSGYFFGLFGPNGPLPEHLTEYVLERRRDFGDVTFARFADVFHHRLLCLFFRAWAAAEPAVAFDRPDGDRFAAYVGSLFGIGTPRLRNRDAMPDRAKLHFAGLLAARTRHPEGLVAILASDFRVPFTLRQFVGHWMRLPDEYLCRLGTNPATGTLGRTATIGSRVWDCQSRFALTAGPLAFEDYLRFLPDGRSLPRLVAVVRNAAGDELSWDLRLVLKRAEVPAARLDGGTALGRTSWLLSRPAERDASDFAFVPHAA
jgi:type VI secretion system protein ImpH